MSNKKKILFVVNYLIGGGVERMLVNIVKSTYQSFDVEILSIYKVNSFYVAETTQYANIKYLDKYRDHFNTTFCKSLYSRLFDKEYIQKKLFTNFLNHNNYDYIVAFSEGYALSLVANTKISGVKKILWIHTDFLNDPKWTESNAPKLCKKFSKYNDIVFVCKTLEEKFKRILKLTSTTCINNGIDLNKIQTLSKAFTPYISNETFEFVSVGRLEHEKGHDKIIEAFSTLSPEEIAKCHLTIIGSGSLENKLKNTVKLLGLDSTITFTGSISNPYPYIKNATALILASKYEGFGLVLIEAMALGTPVIATKTTGSSCVINDGEYGLLISNDIKSISNAIKTIITNDKVLDIYRPKLYKRAEDFSIEKFNKSVIEYFKYI